MFVNGYKKIQQQIKKIWTSNRVDLVLLVLYLNCFSIKFLFPEIWTKSFIYELKFIKDKLSVSVKLKLFEFSFDFTLNESIFQYLIILYNIDIGERGLFSKIVPFLIDIFLSH